MTLLARSVCLFTILFCAATPASSTEWVNLRGLTVWKTVGLLYHFRITQLLAADMVFTDIHDCRTGRGTTIGIKEIGDKVDALSNHRWQQFNREFQLDIHNWACRSVTHRPQPNDRWLDPVPGAPAWYPKMWNIYGTGPNNFRLVYVSGFGSAFTGPELWILNCRLRAVKVLAAGTPSDYMIVNEDWQTSRNDSADVFATFCH